MLKRKDSGDSDGPPCKTSSVASEILPLHQTSSSDILLPSPTRMEFNESHRLEESEMSVLRSPCFNPSFGQQLIFSRDTGWEDIFPKHQHQAQDNSENISNDAEKSTIDQPVRKNLGDEHTITEKNLKCPHCTNLLLPPIRLCLHGHSICGVCASKVRNCPTCRFPLLEGSSNIALETLVDDLVIGCRWKNKGCAKAFRAKHRDLHYKYFCNYVPFNCLLCCSELNLSDFENHYQSCMNGRFKVMARLSPAPGDEILEFEVQYNYLENNYISFCKVENHGIFVLRLKKSKTSVHIYCAVVKCIEEAKCYSCYIKAGNDTGGPAPVLQYSGPISSFLMKEPDILSSGYHMSIPLDVMKNAGDPDNLCPVVYKLKSIAKTRGNSTLFV